MSRLQACQTLYAPIETGSDFRRRPVGGRTSPLGPALAPDRAMALQDRFRGGCSRRGADARSIPWSPRRIALIVLALLGTFLIGVFTAFLVDHIWSSKPAPLPDSVVAQIVDGIIQVESGGNARARNARSTAAGAGQFIEATWLELARRHLPHLKSRSDAEVLQLRFEPELSRTMAGHLVRRNEAVLRGRGLPATPGTLYLAHFAGGAGAAAILSAQHDADAASVMAFADASGKTTREKLVKANPFLQRMTARDLQRWADNKMRSR